mmetsp:Transcript_47204/g.135135  ORF Transcript_47204/g.135135 Transcript_47204/m.135135 type:complete len:268 (-) Transcript_47204:2750-3553(-)
MPRSDTGRRVHLRHGRQLRDEGDRPGGGPRPAPAPGGHRHHHDPHDLRPVGDALGVQRQGGALFAGPGRHREGGGALRRAGGHEDDHADQGRLHRQDLAAEGRRQHRLRRRAPGAAGAGRPLSRPEDRALLRPLRAQRAERGRGQGVLEGGPHGADQACHGRLRAQRGRHQDGPGGLQRPGLGRGAGRSCEVHLRVLPEGGGELPGHVLHQGSNSGRTDCRVQGQLVYRGRALHEPQPAAPSQRDRARDTPQRRKHHQQRVPGGGDF